MTDEKLAERTRAIERLLKKRGWRTRGVFYALKSRAWEKAGVRLDEPEDIARWIDAHAPLGMASGRVRLWACPICGGVDRGETCCPDECSLPTNTDDEVPESSFSISYGGDEVLAIEWEAIHDRKPTAEDKASPEWWDLRRAMDNGLWTPADQSVEGTHYRNCLIDKRLGDFSPDATGGGCYCYFRALPPYTYTEHCSGNGRGYYLMLTDGDAGIDGQMTMLDPDAGWTVGLYVREGDDHWIVGDSFDTLQEAVDYFLGFKPMPRVGDRVRFTQHPGHFAHPGFSELPNLAGETGTVVEIDHKHNGGSPIASVQMDRHFPDLDEWKNCVNWVEDEFHEGFLGRMERRPLADGTYVWVEGDVEPIVRVHNPKQGDRVRFTADVECYPDGLVRQGEYGTVVLTDDKAKEILLDRKHDGLAEWNNCLAWTDISECPLNLAHWYTGELFEIVSDTEGPRWICDREPEFTFENFAAVRREYSAAGIDVLCSDLMDDFFFPMDPDEVPEPDAHSNICYCHDCTGGRMNGDVRYKRNHEDKPQGPRTAVEGKMDLGTLWVAINGIYNDWDEGIADDDDAANQAEAACRAYLGED